MQYKDTYFLNSTEALKVAKQQNKMQGGYWLQCCYYEGEKIDSDFHNLIHCPIDNLVNDLASGIYRIPTTVNCDGLDLDSATQIAIIQDFKMSIDYAQKLRNEINKHYQTEVKNAKLDFTEPLRFYLIGHIQTQVMQYVSKNIADTLEDMGYDVIFNLAYGIEDPMSHKIMSEFNPHITININHLNNDLLNGDVFNFVWFQDAMPVLTNNNKIYLRKRDFVFHLIKGLGELILSKNIKSEYQPFCINTILFTKNTNANKSKKIVYIGNSYQNRINTNTDRNICKALEKIYDQNGIVYDKDIKLISKEYQVSHEVVKHILGYFEKDNLILKLTSLKTKYKFEIYGNGWEKYPELKSYYKGVLNYGKDISTVYNNATYAFVPGGYVLQQRTLEAASCGCIPIIYDKRNENHSKIEDYFEESLVFFNTMDELGTILNSENIYKRNLEIVVKENSYNKFINHMVDIVNKELECNK